MHDGVHDGVKGGYAPFMMGCMMGDDVGLKGATPPS